MGVIWNMPSCYVRPPERSKFLFCVTLHPFWKTPPSQQQDPLFGFIFKPEVLVIPKHWYYASDPFFKALKTSSLCSVLLAATVFFQPVAGDSSDISTVKFFCDFMFVTHLPFSSLHAASSQSLSPYTCVSEIEVRSASHQAWQSATLDTLRVTSGACEWGHGRRRVELPTVKREERDNNSRGCLLCISNIWGSVIWSTSRLFVPSPEA